MKNKLRLLVFGFVAAALLCGCGAKDPTGYYTLSEVVEGDKTVTEKKFDDYGLEESYVVFEGKDVGYFVFFGVVRDFDSDASKGTITLKDGSTMSYSIDGEELTVADSKISLTFEKQDSSDVPLLPSLRYDEY